jgi:formylglycine-generating enzyme required for sulfatase activity
MCVKLSSLIKGLLACLLLLSSLSVLHASDEGEATMKPDKGAAYRDPTTGMEFVYVIGGCYQMGDTFGDGSDDEKPVHEVCIDDFYMGQYTVTQGQWRAVMGDNPSYLKKGDNHPVEQVSWNDAQDFISKLNQMSGKHYRLPTEAEWEYAAREGGRRVSSMTGTGTISSDLAPFDRNKITPVRSFRANSLGLYDMAGKVLQWTGDWYGEKYYSESSMNNPAGPGSGSEKVLRVGNWSVHPLIVRAVTRNKDDPSIRGNNYGFRLVSPGPKVTFGFFSD